MVWVWYGTIGFGMVCIHNTFLIFATDTFISVHGLTLSSFLTSLSIFAVWNSINDVLFGALLDSPSSPRVLRTSILAATGPILALTFASFWSPWPQSLLAPLLPPSLSPVGLHYTLSLCAYDGVFTLVVLIHNALLADVVSTPSTRAACVSANAVASVFASSSAFAAYLLWQPKNGPDFVPFRLFANALAVLGGLAISAGAMGMRVHEQKTVKDRLQLHHPRRQQQQQQQHLVHDETIHQPRSDAERRERRERRKGGERREGRRSINRNANADLPLPLQVSATTTKSTATATTTTTATPTSSSKVPTTLSKPPPAHRAPSSQGVVAVWGIIKTLLVTPNFVWFTGVNFLQNTVCTFNNTFFRLFLDFYLASSLSPESRGLLLALSFVLPHLFTAINGVLLSRMGAYRVIRALFSARVATGFVLWLFALGSRSSGIMSPWMAVCLGGFVVVNRLITEGTCRLMNVALADVVDEDAARHARPDPVSALVFGTNAFLTKPAQSLAPALGWYALAAYTQERPDERGVVSRGLSEDYTSATPSLRSRILALLVWVPVGAGVLQLLGWTRFGLRGPRYKRSMHSV